MKVGDRVRLNRDVRGISDVGRKGTLGTIIGSGIGYYSVRFDDGVERSVYLAALDLVAEDEWGAPQVWVPSADLLDRMVRLVRDVADRNGVDPGVVGNARSIVADLPDEPIDPLLLKAREICAAECTGSEAQSFHDGKRDWSVAMQAVLTALRSRD